MKIKMTLVVVQLVLLWSCETKEKKEQLVQQEGKEKPVDLPLTKSLADLTVYDFDGLEPLLHKYDGKVYVINFWATWCAPCVKELPYFEQINKELKDKNVEVLLVSIDMPKMWESHLIPFIEKHKIASKVVILDDTKQDTWIPKVDKDWSGTIPATVIYSGSKRLFYEEAFTYESLRKEIDNFIKN